MRSDTLNASLRRLRGRLISIEAAAGLGWGLVAAILLLVAWAWLDLVWELAAPLRAVAGYFALAAGAAVCLALLALALRRARHAALARRLDQAANSGGQILSGYDLMVAQPAVDPGASTGASEASLTAGLAALAVCRASGLAAAVPFSLAAPARPALRSSGSVLLLAAMVGLVALAAPRLAGTQWLRFTDPYGDHPPYSRTVLAVEPGNTRVIYGEGLDVLVSTEGPPLDQVDIVLLAGGKDSLRQPAEEVLPMFPESDGKWRATIAEVRASGTYYARGQTARSHRFAIQVITVPRISEVRWRVTPPAYTHDGAYEGPMPQGGLAGLPGTQVEVWAKSNRPLSGGSLDIASGSQRERVGLSPTAAASQEVAGRFEIRQAGKFSLNVTDVAGQQAREPFRGSITLLSDARPFVRLLEPPGQSLATPTATLPVVISAEDDYGLSRVQLFRSLNDSRPLPLDLPLDTPHVRRCEQGTYLPLSAYGLEPGDVIKLFARVEDNDPAGAKGSESTVAVVQIIAHEDYQRMVRAREGMQVFLSKYQQAQRRLESLADEVQGLQKKQKQEAKGTEEAEAQREALARLAKQMQSDAEAIRKSAEQLLPYDLDQSLTQELERLADKLDRLSKEAEQLASQSDLSDEEKARRLEKLLDELNAEKQDFQEQVTQPLEQLADIYPLLEDEARFVELTRRQRDLAERMAPLKGRDQLDDPALKARMRDLEDEQRQLREELGELLDDIETHAARLPDSPELADLVASALEFADAVRSSGASEAMAAAETGLAEFSGTTAQAAADEAADILESFLSRCESMGQRAGAACRGLKFAPGRPGGQGQLGNTLAQLLADAGLGQGQGQSGGEGTGAGSGFSARRNTLSNMGLYGDLPTRGNPGESGGGRGSLAQGGGGPGGSSSRPGQSSPLSPAGSLRASGLSEVAVPVRYRGRVRQYFERIAEETSQ